MGDRGEFLAAQRCPRVPCPGPGRAVLLQDPLPAQQAGGRRLFQRLGATAGLRAWEIFGEANGVASVKEMRARIDHYRRIPIGIGEDPVIGCLFVRDVRFFPGNRAADPPVQFARNIVQGKSYDLADPSVAPYFADLLQLLLGASVELDFSQPWHRPGPVLGDPRLAPYRLGQQSFKAVVLDAYHRRCAISGTHIPPVLQAAHIRPVKNSGEHGSTTGCCSVRTSTFCSTAGTSVWIPLPSACQPALASGLQQRRPVLRQTGQVIELPEHRVDRPGREFLEWLLDEVFLKAAATRHRVRSRARFRGNGL